MKKLAIIVTAILCCSAQASYAQTRETPAQDCTACERSILALLNRIAQNTDNLTTNGAAVRTDIAALRAAMEVLARRPARMPMVIEAAILTDDMGTLEAERVRRYCADIGYGGGRAMWSASGSNIRETLRPGVTRGPIVCFDPPVP